MVEYYVSVWASCNAGLLDDIFKVQKRCARLIFDTPFQARTAPLFYKLEWLSLIHICIERRLILFQKKYWNLSHWETIIIYIISLVMHAFWLVLTHDLLEDRRVDDEHYSYEHWTSNSHYSDEHCSYHILTSSVSYYWTDARQLGIYLLNEILKVSWHKISDALSPPHSTNQQR